MVEIELPRSVIPNQPLIRTVTNGTALAPQPVVSAQPSPVRPSNACDWASIQAAAAGERRQLKMVVEEASLLEFKEGTVELRVAPDLMTAAMGVQEDIRQLINRTWGRAVRVEFAAVGGSASAKAASAASPLAMQAEVPEAGPAMTVANATENPLIAKAVELLGAKVVGVYVRQK